MLENETIVYYFFRNYWYFFLKFLVNSLLTVVLQYKMYCRGGLGGRIIKIPANTLFPSNLITNFCTRNIKVTARNIRVAAATTTTTAISKKSGNHLQPPPPPHPSLPIKTKPRKISKKKSNNESNKLNLVLAIKSKNSQRRRGSHIAIARKK